MLKAFKYRLYPSKSQIELINKHIGCSRFIYNLALETKQIAYKDRGKNLSYYDLANQLPDLKKEVEWLKEVNSQSLQKPIKNLDLAFKRFFKKQGKYPRYKTKGRGKDSFHIPQNVILEDNKLIIPKFKKGIDIKLHRKTKGVIKYATISRTPIGTYYVSILCDTGTKNKVKKEINKNSTIGIDLGLKDFLITSKNEVIRNPRHLKESESKLKYVQRKYSKNKGKRTLNKLRSLHHKVANKRRDFLHKMSSRLVSENQTIAIEDLNVNGMLKNHKLSKSISDVGWSMFTTMLEYKCEWYGVNLIKIGRFQPSSKTCSDCGWVNKDLKLKDRHWVCKSCGVEHDRDFNASVNIKNFALEKYKTLSGTDRETQDELPSLEGVMTLEA